MKNILKKNLLAMTMVALTGVVVLPPVSALAGNHGVIKLRSGATTATVRVTRGKPQTVRTNKPFSEIVVGDPDIANVEPLTDNSFYILGNNIGTTGIALFGRDKQLIGQMDIEVSYDTTSLKKVLRARLPGSNIKVSTANGRIVLSGGAKDAPSVARAKEIAEKYGDEVLSSLAVTSSQQVQLEVRFIEASRNRSKEIGIRWDVLGRRFSSTLGAGGLVSGASPFGAVLGTVLSTGNISVDALINALEEKGLARRLAEPNLVALSGQTASFLAGGEFPIPVAQGNNGSVTVEFKKFGVGLEFTPTVLKDGIINLEIAPEVSEIDFANSVNFGEVEIPSLIVRRAKTTVQLRDGQSFVMAGLLQNSREVSRRQLPWLSDIPVLGALFRSVSYRRKETDLVIIVTPRLVKPIEPGKRILTPLSATLPGNDIDIFLRGKDERTPQSLRRLAKGGTQSLPIGHIIDLN